MDTVTIYDRIEYLREAISYSRVNEGYLSTGQCIMCHQEIAQHYAVLAGRKAKIGYRIDSILEAKAKAAVKMVKTTGFVRPAYYH